MVASIEGKRLAREQIATNPAAAHLGNFEGGVQNAMLQDALDRQQLLAAVDKMSRVEAARFFVSGARYPRFLYKFVRGDRPEALTGFVVSSTIWLSSSLDFNDPFDLRANIHLVGNISDMVPSEYRS